VAPVVAPHGWKRSGACVALRAHVMVVLG
jgi:hypothetical protein